MNLACRRVLSREDPAWPFIGASWLESFRESHFAGPVPYDVYREVYPRIIVWYTEREGAELWVAYNPEASEQWFGFVAIERNVWEGRSKRSLPAIQYIYTKAIFRTKMYRGNGEMRVEERGAGVARALLAAAGINPLKPFVYGWRTAIAAELVAHKKLSGHYNPLAFRSPKPATHGSMETR